MDHRRSPVLDRRDLLRGVGGAALALPFGLLARPTMSRAMEPPLERLVTVFLGNGLPSALMPAVSGPFSNALAPLEPYRSQLTTVRGITAVAEGRQGNGHTRGGASFACAKDYSGVHTKGGPSLDWVAHQATQTDTLHPTLSTGIYGAEDPHERMRIVHSWRGVNLPNEPIPDTLLLFETLFGHTIFPPGSAQAARHSRLRVSVLDAVLEDYKRQSSPRAPYGAETKRVLDSHLQNVRELERRAVALSAAEELEPGCGSTPPPERYHVLESRNMDYWDVAWPVMVELYVAGLHCDLFRFGNLMVTSGGDAFAYSAPGAVIENVHSDAYHKWPGTSSDAVMGLVRWQMEKVAFLLSRLAATELATPETALLSQETTLLIGSELSDPASHSRDDLTFFLVDGQQRLRPGTFNVAERRSDVDLYNTLLQLWNVEPGTFGERSRYDGLLPILA